MVQANKHRKNATKSKKQHAVKKNGKESDLQQLRSQLDALGLKIIQVTADGNCFFRALADQLKGNEEEHKTYREMVVCYILNHREDFEPYIEDDVPFHEYCDSMKEDGTWAGHMELQAASLVNRRNICIHQIMSPRWYIRNFSGQDVGMIHLCYHHHGHYDSVRMKEDSCEGPAKPILLEVDADISVKDHNRKMKNSQASGTSHRRVADNQSVKLVMAGAGCQNADKVEQVLQEVDGDVDAAIEFLIAERNMSESINHDDETPENSTCDGENQDRDSEQLKIVSVDINSDERAPNSDCQSYKDHGIQRDDKKTGRNRECSCGSRKKYKACCGSVVGKSSTVPVTNNVRASKFGGKDKKNRKKETIREVPETGYVNTADIGALCI